MEELVEEISELLVPAEKYDEEDAVVEVLKTVADLHSTLVIWQLKHSVPYVFYNGYHFSTNCSTSTVTQVIPGAGGVEASLFAEEIFNLYLQYTQNLGFQVSWLK